MADQHPGGFSDAHVATLRRLVPALALADQMRRARAHRRDPGRGLSRPGCRPARARAARSRAASPTGSAPCCGSRDLRGYTTIADTTARADHPPAQRLCRGGDLGDPRAGGDVLKLIGDGTLAIFRADDPAGLPRALEAERLRAARRRAQQRRAARGPAGHRRLSRPAYRRRLLRQYRQRRAARLHRRRPGRQRGQPHRRDVPLGRPRIVLSSDFAAARRRRRARSLVSVGRYALRGVGRPRSCSRSIRNGCRTIRSRVKVANHRSRNVGTACRTFLRPSPDRPEPSCPAPARSAAPAASPSGSRRHNLSLAFTSYQTGRLYLCGDDKGRVLFTSAIRSCHGAMGRRAASYPVDAFSGLALRERSDRQRAGPARARTATMCRVSPPPPAISISMTSG